MKNKTKEQYWTYWCCGGASGKLFWGVLLLVLGVWYLARDLGYISVSVSIWPVLLILMGLWLLLRRKNSSR